MYVDTINKGLRRQVREIVWTPASRPDRSIWSESITALLCYQIKPAEPSLQPSSFTEFLWSFLISAHFYLHLSIIYGDVMHHIPPSSKADWHHMTPDLPMSVFMSGDVLHSYNCPLTNSLRMRSNCQEILQYLILSCPKFWCEGIMGWVILIFKVWQYTGWGEQFCKSKSIFICLWCLLWIASSLLLPQCWEECFCK